MTLLRLAVRTHLLPPEKYRAGCISQYIRGSMPKAEDAVMPSIRRSYDNGLDLSIHSLLHHGRTGVSRSEYLRLKINVELLTQILHTLKHVLALGIFGLYVSVQGKGASDLNNTA